MTKQKRQLTDEQILWKENLKEIWLEKKKIHGFSQESAAFSMDMGNQATVSHYLNGHMPLNTNAILAFATFLDVDPARINPKLKEFNLLAPRSPNISDDIAMFMAEQLQNINSFKKMDKAICAKFIQSIYDEAIKKLKS